MGNTFFYKQVKTDASKIRWKDIFSESRKKHSKEELEYALSAGTAMNTANEADMLKKWHKPWVWYRLFIIGLILIAFTFAVYFISIKIEYIVPAIQIITIVIPPLIIPLVVLVFLWELNVPKNISIYELVGYFFVGGVTSLLVTEIILRFIATGDTPASYAAFTEEPAKLIAALLCMLFFTRKKKLYGINGVIIGAAVGAGFSAFESAQYALMGENSGLYGAMYMYVYSRLIGAFGTHTLWCASYSGGYALACKKGKMQGGAFLDMDFLIMFIGAVALHFSWNAFATYSSEKGLDRLVTTAAFIGFILLQWLLVLYIVKKCLHQVIAPAGYTSGSAQAYAPAQMAAASAQAAGVAASVPGTPKLTVVCVDGAIKGAVWQSMMSETLTIGREEGNVFKIPGNVAGISRQHCIIQYTDQGWAVRDLNSTYGTSVNGVKLAPGQFYILREGDIIQLAQTNQTFRVTYQG